MKKIVILAAGASLLAGAAQAQTDFISNPSATISNFDVSTVGPILSELGIVWQADQTDDGENYITGNIGGQFVFLMVPAACRNQNNTDCVGVNILGLFEGQANPQTVNAFNYRYAFASAGINPDDGSAYINRYEIADYGMARGNLATSIMVFASLADNFRQTLYSASQTVSLDGYADDLSSRLLNREGLTSMTGFSPVITSDLARHEIGFEESNRQIKYFISNKSTPRNKIRNVTAK